MGESYYNKDYNISPKVREMIEKRMGKIYDLSYVQVENVINNIFKGEINTEKKYTDNDKEKLISMLSETSPNRMNDDNINSVVKFCKVSLTDDEFKKYIDYCIRKYYKPGMVYNGIKIFNGGVTKVAKDSNLYNVKQGVILNKTYVNDLLPLFDNDETRIKYDEKTLIVDGDYTIHIKTTFDEIKLNNDIEYLNTEELFVVVCNNEESVTYLKDKYGFKIVDVLEFSYYVMEDEDDSDDAMNKLKKILGEKSPNSDDDDMDYIGSSEPSNWYFDVYVDESQNTHNLNPSQICLSEYGNSLDDRLGSHNLPIPIKKALKRAGIYSESESMEAIWEVNNYMNKTKEDIINSMKNEGFKYKSGLMC